MGFTRRKVGFAIVTTAIGATAGCAGWAIGDERDQTDGSRTKRTDTDEKTSSPTTSVRTVFLRKRPPFPGGPKENRLRRACGTNRRREGTPGSTKNGVSTTNTTGEDASEYTISCSVPSVEKTQEGYAVTLLCQGAVYSESSATHGDYIGPKVVYHLAPSSVERVEEN